MQFYTNCSSTVVTVTTVVTVAQLSYVRLGGNSRASYSRQESAAPRGPCVLCVLDNCSAKPPVGMVSILCMGGILHSFKQQSQFQRTAPFQPLPTMQCNKFFSMHML